MGGGAVMKAATKVAGIGLGNGTLRGVQAENPISAAARKATRPVSVIVSSSDEGKSNVLVTSQNEKNDASVQRPCWELDDWEFAGEEELFVETRGPMPRVVFGGAPTLQEAKEATTELKDVLEKVYLTSPRSSGGSYVAATDPCLPLPSNSEELETKACVTSKTTVAPPMPKHAIQAFRFLHETPAAQTVVASIASDPNVWNAVMQNDALMEFFQSQKNSAPNSDIDPNTKESVGEVDPVDAQSPKSFDESSVSGESDSGNGFTGFFQNIKLKVVDMMSSLSDYCQNLFGDSTSEKKSADNNGSAGSSFMEKSLGASIMGLSVMVIMVVVLKRV